MSLASSTFEETPTAPLKMTDYSTGAVIPSTYCETDVFTRTLNATLSGSSNSSFFLSFDPINPEPSCSASGSASPAVPMGHQAGKTSKKRKSRAKNRNQTTTYITTDPVNFRRLVQEATGFRVGTVIEPEPVRLEEGSVTSQLDTSPGFLGPCGSFEPGLGDGPRIELNRFQNCYFPTLESWSVM